DSLGAQNHRANDKSRPADAGRLQESGRASSGGAMHGGRPAQESAYFVLAALSFSSWAFFRVSSGFFLAVLTHILQHRKTGSPFSITLTGAPISPRRFSGSTAHHFCASAILRSVGLSLARLAWIL